MTPPQNLNVSIVPPPTAPRRSLALKLSEVMAELGRIPKRGRNEHFGYDYVMEADIVEAVRQHLSSKQIVLLPSLLSERRDGTITTATVAFTFADGETGETFTCNWAGTGDDKSDKGLFKAYTGCVKTFLMKTFLLPSGDDPEKDDKATAKPKAARPTAVKAQPPATVDTRTGEVLDEPAADHYRIRRAWIDKSGTKNNRPWTLYAIETTTDDIFRTFDAGIYDAAQACVKDGTFVEIVTEAKRFGKQIVTFTPEENQPHEDDNTDPDRVPF